MYVQHRVQLLQIEGCCSCLFEAPAGFAPTKLLNSVRVHPNRRTALVVVVGGGGGVVATVSALLKTFLFSVFRAPLFRWTTSKRRPETSGDR